MSGERTENAFQPTDTLLWPKRSFNLTLNQKRSAKRFGNATFPAINLDFCLTNFDQVPKYLDGVIRGAVPSADSDDNNDSSSSESDSESDSAASTSFFKEPATDMLRDLETLNEQYNFRAEGQLLVKRRRKFKKLAEKFGFR